MSTNYHNEALRKQRVLDKKREAIERLKESGLASGDISFPAQKNPTPLVHSEPGQYLQSSNIEKPMMISKDDVVFEEVVHDPNFKYRTLKDSDGAPVHVDPIYRIMYPGGERK